MTWKTRFGFLGAVAILILQVLCATSRATATVWHAATGGKGSDANPGTAERPVSTVAKAVSLAKPGDTVVFSPGTYPCSQVTVPDGRPDLPILLRREGKGKVIFTNNGSGNILVVGSYNTVDGIEFEMVAEESAERMNEHDVERSGLADPDSIIRWNSGRRSFVAVEPGSTKVSTSWWPRAAQ